MKTLHGGKGTTIKKYLVRHMIYTIMKSKVRTSELLHTTATCDPLPTSLIFYSIRNMQ